MSALILESKVASDSDMSRAAQARNHALRNELRAKVAKAALGGSESARELYRMGRAIPDP